MMNDNMIINVVMGGAAILLLLIYIICIYNKESENGSILATPPRPPLSAIAFNGDNRKEDASLKSYSSE